MMGDEMHGLGLADFEKETFERFRLAALKGKMTGQGIWKNYTPTPEEEAEWKMIQSGKKKIPNYTPENS